CGVGAIGGVPIRLGKGRVSRTKQSVHLVRRDVQEAETLAIRARKRLIEASGFLEKAEGAHYVGLHEGGRAGDRAVDMALSGEVNDGARLVLRQELAHQLAVADVALDERVAPVLAQGIEVAQVSRVGKLVEV